MSTGLHDMCWDCRQLRSQVLVSASSYNAMQVLTVGFMETLTPGWATVAPATEDRSFNQVIAFPYSLYLLNGEASMFKHAAQLEIGFGASYGMNNPLDP